VRRGRISQITDFGLFINLGGLDGLVHISELSWGRIEKPAEVYSVGQRIKVKVLNIDRERQRIALSIKALNPDPWLTAPERYIEGTLIEGKVSQMVDFGAFIELEPGVEGLLHNSELGAIEQRAELEASKRVLVKVIRVEPDRRRIGLSVRQVRRDEWEAWAAAQANAPAPSETTDHTVSDEDEDMDDMDTFEGLDMGVVAVSEEAPVAVVATSEEVPVAESAVSEEAPVAIVATSEEVPLSESAISEEAPVAAIEASEEVPQLDATTELETVEAETPTA